MVRPHSILSIVVAMGLSPARAQESIFSGPQPGEKTPAFKVLGFTGPNAGKEFELAASGKSGPTLLVFVHELTRPASQLMRPLDSYGSKLAEDGFTTHFVWLAADRSAAEDRLRAVQGAIQFKSPISISLDGLEGPGSYGLNRKVALTVLAANENKVVANFAITQPNETDAPKILEAMAKLVGKTPPTLAELGADRANMRRDTARPAATRPADDSASVSRLSQNPSATVQELEERIKQMRAEGREYTARGETVLRLEGQIARLQQLDQEHHARAVRRVEELEKLVGELIDSLNDARAKLAKLEGTPAPAPLKKPSLPAEPRSADTRPTDATRRTTDTPKTDASKKDAPNLPGRTPMDPEIIALMRRMIQPTNDEAKVKEITDEMLKWAGDNPQRKDDLKQFAIRIAHVGYGSDAAKAAIKKLAAME